MDLHLWKLVWNPVVRLLLGIAIALALISWCLFRWTDFGGNLLLNLVAEVFGLAATAILALLVARELGVKKVRYVAGDLAHLVKELREGGTITKTAARAVMVFSSKMIFEDVLSEADSKSSANVVPFREHEPCPICNLTYESTESGPHGLSRRCAHCKLPSGAWKLVKITSKQ
jgi:hypothetical protein